MAITADRRFTFYGDIPPPLDFPMKATTGVAYAGGLVVADSSGNVTNGTDAASVKCVGVAAEGKTNTGSAGAERLNCYGLGATIDFAIYNNSLGFSDIGGPVYLYDNETVAASGSTSNSVFVGILRAIQGGRALVALCMSLGAVGPTGATGPTGPTGPTGATGA